MTAAASKRSQHAPRGLTSLALGLGRALVGKRFTGTWAELDSLQWRSRDELAARADRRLSALLQHACEHVPFYREHCRRERIDPRELRTVADLARLPVVDKATFRAHDLAHFFADDVPAHRRLPYTTSGSTGDPFRFVLDRNAMPLVFASHLFYDSWFGLDPFDRCLKIMGPPVANPPMPAGTPLGFRIRQSVAARLQRAYERLTQKRFSMFDVDPARIDEIYASIELFRPAYLLGYTSSLATLADEFLRRGLRPSRPLKAVVTIAETLTPNRKRLLDECFAAPIANRYGQREFKYWCAQSCDRSPLRFHVNTELVVWETLRDDGSPAAPGEVGRVVLTNLHNHAMPFLRYDTKDLAAVDDAACACGRGFPVVGQLDGRSQECLILPSGRMINPTSLGHYLFVVHGWVDAVRHYQLVQRAPDDVLLQLVLADGDASTAARIAGDVQALLGEGIRVDFAVVSEIPLERSGKRPIIKVLHAPVAHGAGAAR